MPLYKALFASIITFILMCVTAGFVFDRGFFVPALAATFILIMGSIVTFWLWWFDRRQS